MIYYLKLNSTIDIEYNYNVMQMFQNAVFIVTRNVVLMNITISMRMHNVHCTYVRVPLQNLTSWLKREYPTMLAHICDTL